MANEFKIKNGLIVSGSVDIEQNLTVRGTLTTDGLTGDVDYSNIINAPTLVSGSAQISFNGITDKPTLISGSSQILNSSGIWSGSAQLPNGVISGSAQLPTDIISSSAQLETLGYATTGSNDFIGTQTITGSLYISQNLIVQGSSSLENITGSNVYIGTNKINLNTDTPAIRFGGVSVFDSGSNFGESGSLLWDSQANHWIYQHPSSSGAPYGSAMLISGPKNTGSLGNEQGLTIGKISKAVGDDHIGDSIISEIGGGIGVGGLLTVTGSGTFSGIIAANSTTTAANGSINIENLDPAIRFRVTNGTANKRIYEWRAVAAGGVNDIMQLRSWNDAQNSASTLLSITPTGAATFSGRVTATEGEFNYPGTTSLYLSNNSISAGNSSGTTGLYMGDAGSGVNVLTREKVTVNTAYTSIYSEYGYNNAVKAVQFFNGSATFFGNVAMPGSITVNGVMKTFTVNNAFGERTSNSNYFRVSSSGGGFQVVVYTLAQNPGVGWSQSQVFQAVTAPYWGGWVGTSGALSTIGSNAGYLSSAVVGNDGTITFRISVGDNGTTTSSSVMSFIQVTAFNIDNISVTLL